MSILDFFKPKPKRSQSYADAQWNRMWELWANWEVPSPYFELMNYSSEVNNGGHGQYFLNAEDNRDLDAEVRLLITVLPAVHAENLRTAYAFWCSDDSDDICPDEFDLLFYTNEASINRMLEQYARTIVL